MDTLRQVSHAVEAASGSNGIDPTRTVSRLSREEQHARSVLDRVGTFLAVVVITALTASAIAAGGMSARHTLLRTFAVVVLACLPGWLFVRFMVFRAGSLWTEYVLNIHRLGLDDHKHLPRPPIDSGYEALWKPKGEPDEHAPPPPKTIYQQKFEAYYGQAVGPDAPRRNPLTLKTLPPVLLTTAVLAVGWTAVLAGRNPLSPEPLELPVDSLRFGFVGAYVFIVQMLIRRFFQSDLKPSAYIGAVVRIASVLAMVLVVHHALPHLSDDVEVATAFVIGFFPLLGMQILHKVVSVPFTFLVHTLRTPYPLSDLDGLNIWYEARLLEEGIEDLQNLVTGNLVDIILHTRVPVERLVDWIDQAALQLLLDPPAKDTARSRGRQERNALRRLGVRTATDLETMFLPAERLARRPSSTVVPDDGEFQERMRRVLSTPDGPSVPEALLRNFSNIPNLVYVRHWRDILGTEHHLIEHAPTR